MSDSSISLWVSSFVSFAVSIVVLCLRIPFQLFVKIPLTVASKIAPILLVALKDASPEPLYSYLNEMIKRQEEGESILVYMASSIAPYVPLICELYRGLLEHLGKSSSSLTSKFIM